MEIKTFEQACEIKGYDPVKILPDVSAFPARHQAALTATAKMYVITEAANEGWEPDWNNNDEYKYYPWFDMEYDKEDNPSGFRFNGAGYGYASARSAGGSRLCYKTRKLAQYIGETFIDLWRDMIVLPK